MLLTTRLGRTQDHLSTPHLMQTLSLFLDFEIGFLVFIFMRRRYVVERSGASVGKYVGCTVDVMSVGGLRIGPQNSTDAAIACSAQVSAHRSCECCSAQRSIIRR